MAAGALALAPGPHPRRELTLILRLGVPWPRLRMAAGALALAPGPQPPARTDADPSPRRALASAQDGRRRSCTGAGAPPPARTDADPSPRRALASAQDGRRRSCTGAGA